MDSAESPPSPPVEDSSLRCLNCDYNLTGLSEGRCPECGEAFDRDVLLRIAAGEPMPATPWDAGQSLSRFLDTWAMALWQPRRLARRFPPCHDAGNAIGYSCVSYCLAGVLFVPLSLLPQEEGLTRIALSIALGAVVACWICETAVAGLLALLVKPTHVKRRYHFWRGLAHYTSSYAILTGIWGAAVFVCFDLLLNDAVTFLLVCSAVVVFVWWASALCVMVVSRSSPGPRRVLACVAIPLVGFGATLLGIVNSYVFAILCLAPW